MPRVRTQRKNEPECGISGTSSSPSPRNPAIVSDASAPLSAKEAWIPEPARPRATSITSPAGARTTKPTSRLLVSTRLSGCTPRNSPANAVTSSVDMSQVLSASKSASWVTNATIRKRHNGIGLTRRCASSTRSTAAGSSLGSASGAAECRWGGSASSGAESVFSPATATRPSRGCGARPLRSWCSAKLACTWSRSSRVSFASRRSPRSAIARVFRRA